MRAGFYLQELDEARLESSLVASAWLRMVELMHDMQQRHMHGLVEGELPGDAELAEEAIHQVPHPSRTCTACMRCYHCLVQHIQPTSDERVGQTFICNSLP